LRIRFSDPLRKALVADAYGNVGLLQRLAEQVCLQEGIGEAQSEVRAIELGATLEQARAAVAAQMRGRFQAFADNFVRGMRRLAEGLEVYRHLLQTFTESTDTELIEGLDSAELLNRVGHGIRQSDLTQALVRVDRLQTKIGISPPVLTYSSASRKVFVVDRSFLFYRRYGAPSWPWGEGEAEFTNDLAEAEPLVLD